MTVDRRVFTGLLVGLPLVGVSPLTVPRGDSQGTDPKLGLWVRIAPDDRITLYVARAEEGQGIYTAAAMLIAEELDADWSKIRVEPAPHSFHYLDRPIEITGCGRSSIHELSAALRLIGAKARAMLVAAAAKRWNVPAGECATEKSSVRHGEKRLRYGELAAEAGAAAGEPKLKDPSRYTIVGKPTKRLDARAKLDGAPLFAIDVHLPDMMHATVLQSPIFGGDVANFPALQKTAAAKMQSSRLVKIPNGVAMASPFYWQAKNALALLDVKWKGGKTEKQTSAKLLAKLRDGIMNYGTPIVQRGDHTRTFRSAHKKIVSEYVSPFLAHAPLEPVNCVAKVAGGKADIWIGSQSPARVAAAAADFLKMPEGHVTVHQCYLGGSFGRRAEVDMVQQALAVAKELDGKPVKLVWSREEELRHGFYRPAAIARLEGAIDEKGRVTTLGFRMATSAPSESIAAGGLDDVRYEVPNQRLEITLVDTGVPVGYFRGVGHTTTAFALETFIDELAFLAARDPVAFRRDLLMKHKRHVAVLDAVARISAWKTPPPKGHFRGVALHGCFGSIVAHVVEVSIHKTKLVLHKVWTAIDCGRVVNPAGVVAAMETGVAIGLSAALRGEITLGDGRVTQSNFHDYAILAPSEAPEIEVTLVPSDAEPGSASEASVPTVAPALVNAVYAAIGKRCRVLPLSRYKLVGPV